MMPALYMHIYVCIYSIYIHIYAYIYTSYIVCVKDQIG